MECSNDTSLEAAVRACQDLVGKSTPPLDDDSWAPKVKEEPDEGAAKKDGEKDKDGDDDNTGKGNDDPVTDDKKKGKKDSKDTKEIVCLCEPLTFGMIGFNHSLSQNCLKHAASSFDLLEVAAAVQAAFGLHVKQLGTSHRQPFHFLNRCIAA